MRIVPGAFLFSCNTHEIHSAAKLKKNTKHKDTMLKVKKKKRKKSLRHQNENIF
jgi:hypothetical protein